MHYQIKYDCEQLKIPSTGIDTILSLVKAPISRTPNFSSFPKQAQEEDSSKTGLDCCPLIGGGFFVVNSLLYVPPIVCGVLCLVFVLVCITLLPF